MSREIKFRAWDRKQMVTCWFQTVFLPVPSNRNRFVQKWFSGCDDKHEILAQDTAVMQYTGLKDTLGVEIYEGDICKFISPMQRQDLSPAVVEWSDDGAYWGLRGKLPLLLHRAVDIEIIGNIHQNPTLMKEKE